MKEFEWGGRIWLQYGPTQDDAILRANHNWNVAFPNDPILKGQFLHHKDENPQNDDISNLQKVTRREHAIIHRTGKVHSAATKQLIGAANAEAWRRDAVNREAQLAEARKNTMRDPKTGRFGGK